MWHLKSNNRTNKKIEASFFSIARLSRLSSKLRPTPLFVVYMMSVTFFIPIMLAHAWGCARVYAHHDCMHVHTRNSLRAEVGHGGAARGGEGAEGGERKREAERNNVARVSCEYNAESTYRRFQHGVDGDLVVGNSPRLTPPSLSRSPPSRRRAMPSSAASSSSVPLFLAACRHRTSLCVLPFFALPPVLRGGVIVPYTLPTNYMLPSPFPSQRARDRPTSSVLVALLEKDIIAFPSRAPSTLSFSLSLVTSFALTICVRTSLSLSFVGTWSLSPSLSFPLSLSPPPFRLACTR